MNQRRSLLVNCLAESRWMLAFWLICFAWVIGYSLSFGFGHDRSGVDDGQEIAIVGGVPSWVFWGVGMPWLVATVFSSWFALSHMQDDSLDGDTLDADSSVNKLIDATDDETANKHV